MYSKKEEIYPNYVSKHNLNREKQVFFSNDSKAKKWRYLALKKLSALLRAMTSKNSGDFYCFNCLHSCRTKSKLKSHKRVCKNEDFCNIILLSEDTKTLEFNQYKKLDKTPYILLCRS